MQYEKAGAGSTPFLAVRKPSTGPNSEAFIQPLGEIEELNYYLAPGIPVLKLRLFYNLKWKNYYNLGVDRTIVRSAHISDAGKAHHH